MNHQFQLQIQQGHIKGDCANPGATEKGYQIAPG